MDLKVTDPKGFRYGGEHYAEGAVIENARDREANLLIAIGKAEKYEAPKKRQRKVRKDYETRDMKAE